MTASELIAKVKNLAPVSPSALKLVALLDQPAISNEDIVVWHTFGHTHVCKPEDFPVMPVEYAGFTLKPNGFFAENPAMDIPPDRNTASKDDRGAGSCCA
jgi:hypothetical protein